MIWYTTWDKWKLNSLKYCFPRLKPYTFNFNICCLYVQRDSQNPKVYKTDKISLQPENWGNGNDPDFVQEFPKQWCFEPDSRRQTLPVQT